MSKNSLFLTILLFSCAHNRVEVVQNSKSARRLAAAQGAKSTCLALAVEATYESIYQFAKKNLEVEAIRKLFGVQIGAKVTRKKDNEPYHLKSGESIDTTTLPAFYGTRMALVKSSVAPLLGDLSSNSPSSTLVSIKSKKSKAPKVPKQVRPSVALCSRGTDSGWVETRLTSPQGSLVFAQQTEEVNLQYDPAIEFESFIKDIEELKGVNSSDRDRIRQSLLELITVAI